MVKGVGLPETVKLAPVPRYDYEYGDGVPYQLAALKIDVLAMALPWRAD